MWRRWLLIAGVFGPLAAAAHADDESPRSTVAEAVAALTSADAKQRRDAVEALAQERPERVDEIVAAAASHAADDSVWTGLAEALPRWGGCSAADALSRTRAAWPTPIRSRLDLLVHDLRLAEDLGPFPDVGTSPPEVAEKVIEKLAKYDGPPHYTEPNPDAAAIARLGRDAIPALVSDLRERRERRDHGFRSYAAADALGLLAEERDVPALRRLLDEGCSAAARSLRRLRSPAALDALVAAVERDLMSHDVTTSLVAQDGGLRADLAVIGWVERNAGTANLLAAAEYLSGRRCEEAVPVLERALPDLHESDSRVVVAGTLSNLGVRAGIEALLECLDAPVGPFAAERAGEALNAVVGRRVFKGDPWRTSSGAAGDLAAATAEFRRWWDANADKLVFDREARRWRLADEVPFVLPESPPEVAAQVRALLAGLGEGQTSSAGMPVVSRIVELGRDAVPELLRQLRDAPERRHGGGWLRTRVVTDALAELVEERDVPAVSSLLADGRPAAAECLVRLHCDAARDALVGALRKGAEGYEVAKALRPYASDPIVRDAAVAWIREFGATAHSVGEVAGVVSEAGGDGALEALRDVMVGGVAEHARAPVAAAVARLGGKDGVEALLLLAESDERGATDAASALNGICGRQVFITRTFGPIGRSGNIDEASAWFRRWWEESKDSLRFDAGRRCWTTSDEGPALDVGTSPPEVAARVAEILAKLDAARGFATGAAEVRELVALGRDAIPALVERIRAGEAWDDSPGRSSLAAAKALRELRTDDDVAMLVRLLREGRLAVAASLAGCRDPRAWEARHSVVARGFDDMATVRALETTPADAATWEALRHWLRGAKGRSGVWVGSYAEVHATPEAAPVLREALALPSIDSVLAVRCATGLAQTGEKDGIEALLRLVDGPPSKSGWSQDARDLAGFRLNAIAGRRIFVEADVLSPGTSHEEAATAFRAWWEEHGGRLVFDPVRRVWTTGTPAPAVPGATDVAPALLDAAESILAGVRSAGVFFSGPGDRFMDPHAVELVALGPGVLPFLVATVRRGLAWDDDTFRDKGVRAAEQALVALAEKDDRATMLELLAEGRLGVAYWFVRHPSPEGRDALLEVVRRGFLDGVVLDALGPHAGEAPVHETLVAWAQAYGRFHFDEADALAEFLAAPPHGADAPLLPDLLARPIPAHTRWRIAAALAKRGVKPGVEALASIFAAGEGLTEDDAAYVARALGEIAGEDLVEVVDELPGRGRQDPDRPRTRTHRVDKGPGVVKDPAAAAARVRRWWAENGDRLRFDAATARWVLGS